MTYLQPLLTSMSIDFIHSWCVMPLPKALDETEMKIAVHDDFFTYCGCPL